MYRVLPREVDQSPDMKTGRVADMQKQRLKHLLANAILELWKKETGSLASVFIEGTICITAGSGKTTVVQVADKFCGSIPEADDSGFDHTSTPKSFMSLTPQQTSLRHKLNNNSLAYTPYGPPVDYQNQAAMAAYYDHLSPASLVSPSTDPAASRSRSPVSERHRLVESVLNQSTGIKEEMLSDSDDDEMREETASPSGTGGIIAGTGYYTTDTADNTPRTTPQPELTTPTERTSTPLLTSTPTDIDSSKVIDALDLSRVRDNDLAISSPQSYTAQVRNVIRQRLLAQKASSLTNLNQEDSLKQDREETSGTPSMLSSLGLHRSDKSSGSGDESQDSIEDNVVRSHSTPSSATSNVQQAMPINMQLPFAAVANRASVPNNGQLHDILRRSKPQGHILPHHMYRSHPYMLGLPTMVNPGILGQMEASLAHLNPNFLQQQNGGLALSKKEGEEDQNNNSNDGEQKVYKCEFCTKTFLFKSKYQEHLPVHTNARPFQCHLCSRTYKYKYDLRVHLRTHMGIPTKSTVCPFCNTKFNSNKMVRQHIKECHNDRQRVAEDVVCSQLPPGENLPPPPPAAAM